MTTELYALDYHDTRSIGTTAVKKQDKRRRVSETEYWEKYYHAPDVTYEWNNGYLEEKAVSKLITYSMYQWFSELLNHFLRTHSIAKTTGLEFGFRLVLPDSTEIRRPDLGVVLNSNSVPLLPDDSSYKGTFDLCIEAISESTKKDIERDTVSKKSEYAEGGVKEYYILDGYDRYLEFYRLNDNGVYMPIEPTAEGIIKSEELPGFQFRREDLFTKPSPKEMIADPIYQGFVLPDLTTKQKVEEEKRARLQAERRALEEKRARQAEELARRKAEEQASEEKRARHQAETEIAHLKALLEKWQKAR
jgi:Uma2 family endonuclease